MSVELDSIVVRNNELFTASIDDELVCLDETSGNYYGLNSTGAIIWEMMKEPVSVQKIIDNVLAQYLEARDVIANDIVTYLNALYTAHENMRLVTVCT